MNISEEQHIKLLRFLEGKMNLDEINLLKKELSENTHLKFHLDLLIALETSSLPENIISHKNKILQLSYFNRAIAATIALLISITILIQNASHNNSSKSISIIKDFDSSPKDSLTIKDNRNEGIPSPVDSLINKTPQQPHKKTITITPSEFASDFNNLYMKDSLLYDIPKQIELIANEYKNSNYEEVQNFNLDSIKITRTRSVGQKDKKEIVAIGLYIKGLSYIEMKNFEAAITYLENAKKNLKDIDFKAKCDWYLALLYFRNRETNLSISLLREINKSNSHLYKKECNELINFILKER